MEGIILRVKMDGNLVREFKYPSNLAREWDMGAEEKGS
jgi:hypothetical protein